MRTPEVGEEGKKPADAGRWRVSRRGLAGAASLLVALMASRGAQAAQTNWMPQRRRRPKCFLAGTRILTPKGEVEIEQLCTGDLVCNVVGEARSIKAIEQWGCRHSALDPVPESAWPVLISRHALDDCTPDRDLFVTEAHALLLDGMLVPVGSLINGTTIARVDPARMSLMGVVSYFHIELETHDVIIANGAPCESLLVDARTKPYAPIVAFNGGRAELSSRMRSAVSPLIDRRTALDRLRDRLENRASLMMRRAA